MTSRSHDSTVEGETRTIPVQFPPETPGTTYHLFVLEEDGKLETYPLPEEGEVSLGRSDQAGVTIQNSAISRVHAILHRGPPLAIEDLGSTNGSVMNNVVRLAPKQPVHLKRGDVVRLGNAVSIWVGEAMASTGHLRQVGAIQERKNRKKAVLSDDVVVQAPSMQAMYQLIERVAPSTINVLLQGETGVGKEVVAHHIHERSTRRAMPFMAINCAALSETLFESELFGHEKGAFTGANEAKPGLLEKAGGGTIFLDEVGELSPASQAKLLRALEEEKVFRVGSLKPTHIDVRFLAATNRDLPSEVFKGGFREDLYFRLNGVTIDIPPLRERSVEIEPLARQFVERFSSRLARPVPELSREAFEFLMHYHWPGNVRELRNVIERGVLLSEDGQIELRHLCVGVRDRDTVREQAPTNHQETHSWKRVEMELDEREQIRDALQACQGNQSRAAKVLGISRSTLVRKLDRYGLPRPRKQIN